MLYTPASSESIPLFSTALPTSLPMSCSTEGRLVIQRPVSESVSFDWSDFPIVQQQAVFEHFSFRSPHTPYDDDNMAVTRPTMSRRDDLSTTSFNSLLSTSTSSSTDSLSNSNHSGRRVKFSHNIKVRTHTIVLGDHPCCKSLPLELGWDYDESEVALNEPHRRRRNGAARRRPYLERKAMLKSISGMTDAEIKYIVTSKLRAVGPSSRSLNVLGYDL
jgi:hypothetical protein